MEKEQVESETQRKRFPRWTRAEQDCWQELFRLYAEQLMDSHLDSDSQVKRASFEALKEDIEQAALLADHAMLEIQYRFFIQEKAPRQRKR